MGYMFTFGCVCSPMSGSYIIDSLNAMNVGRFGPKDFVVDATPNRAN